MSTAETGLKNNEKKKFRRVVSCQKSEEDFKTFQTLGQKFMSKCE